MGNKGGTSIFAAIVVILVFFLIYYGIVNPYTNPTEILQQFFNEIWGGFISTMLSIFGLFFTAVIIALVAGGLVLKSKSQ